MTNVRRNLDLYVGDLSFRGAPTPSNVYLFSWLPELLILGSEPETSYPQKVLRSRLYGRAGRVASSQDYRENLRPLFQTIVKGFRV